jgi:hypothetical protein
MEAPTYYIDGLFRQGNAALARNYLGISGSGSQGPQGPQGDQGPQGAPGSNGTSSDVFTAQNKDISTLTLGMPAAIHPSGTGLVIADASGTSKQAIGLVSIGAAPTFAATVQIGGVITISDWTPIIGSTTLSAMSRYYLSTVPGKLTATAPSTPGQIVQVVGFSLSTTAMEIIIQPPILL